jgi:hypothetical protein
MKNQLGNQAAFPTELKLSNEADRGLTKREYFSAMAMQGMISTIETVTPSNALEVPVNVAKWAVLYADELLKQLEKTEL